METQPQIQKYKNLSQVLIISFGFLLLFSAFSACQSISAKILKDLGFKNLGFVNISLIYLSFAVTAMFAAPINKRLGTRKTLILSGLAYALWIAMFLVPTYRSENSEKLEFFLFSDTAITVLSMLSSVIIGIGAGPLWVSQSFHIATCANETNKGLYNGIFLSIANISFISSNLLAATLIQNVKKTTFYFIMAMLAVFGCSVFLFVKTPIKAEDSDRGQTYELQEQETVSSENVDAVAETIKQVKTENL